MDVGGGNVEEGVEEGVGMSVEVGVVLGVGEGVTVSVVVGVGEVSVGRLPMTLGKNTNWSP